MANFPALRHQQKSQSHLHILPAGLIGDMSGKKRKVFARQSVLCAFLPQLMLTLQRHLQLILSIKKGANKKIKRCVENK